MPVNTVMVLHDTTGMMPCSTVMASMNLSLRQLL